MQAAWQGKLENIIENIAEGILVVNLDGIIVLVNAAAERLLGANRSDIVGRLYNDPMWKRTTEDGKPFSDEDLCVNLVIKTGQPVYGIEFLLTRPDGTKIFVSANAMPLRDDAGVLTAVLLSFTDISTIKRAAALLRESEERYRRLVELSPDGIAVHTEGKIVYVNAAGAKIFGMSNPEDAVGKSLLTFVHPDYRDIVIKRVKEMQQGKIVGLVEETFARIDGTPVDVEVAASPILYNGKPSVQVVFRDITERKKIEAALRETSQALQALFKAAPVGIIAFDLNGIVEVWNPGAEHIFGWTQGEAIGHPLPFVTEDKMNEFLALRDRVIQGHIIQGIEIERSRKDGSKIDISLSAAPLYNDEGKISGIMGVVSDITARKQSEQAVRESEANYRAIFNAANDAIFVHDMNTGEILDSNKKASEMYDYAENELRRLSIVDLSAGTPPYTQEDAVNWVKKTIKEGPQLFEWKAKDRFGRIFWVEVNLKRAVVGGADRVLAVVRDIGRRKILEEERTRLAKQIELLLESTDEGIYALDLDGKCILINKAATEMIGYSAEEMLGKSMHSLMHHTHPDGSPYPIEECPIYHTVSTGQGVRVDTDVFWRKDGSSFPVEYSSYPIVEEGVRTGVVATFTDITQRKQAENKLRVAKELSDALNSINATINSTLDFDEIMERVVVESAGAIGADTAGIALIEDERWVVGYLYGRPKLAIGTRLPEPEVAQAKIVAATKQPFIIRDTLKDPRINSELMKKFGIKSILAVPLLVREEVIGVLRFVFIKNQVDFNDAQIDFANKLATAISFAIENARLYEAERNIADTLQEALLTVPEKMPGLDFSYLYRSASIAAKVGGDFYDLFELEHDKVGIVIGDVSGKGLEAATLTSLVKNTIKAYAYEGSSPALIMQKTNDVVVKASTPIAFVTAFFGILDKTTGRLTYCNAGHPPGILRKESSEVCFLMASSPMIGAFTGLNYVDDEAVINEGDMLVFYTDGVTESRCEDGFFGEEGLVNLIKTIKIRSAYDITSAIFNTISNCTGGKLSDDVALLAISLKP